MLCRTYLDELTGRRWSRYGFAISLKAFNVKFNRLLDESKNILSALSGCCLTWEVWHVGPVHGFTFLNNDHVFHCTKAVA
jgi:hypothetical protein